jgi:16S rRNA (adenine1518-N6/adenine1519-N6)-dimethyltransferase
VVHTFEIDRSLEPALNETLAAVAGDVRLHWEDVLRAPLEALEPAPTLCASNLPYSVAAPFLAEGLARLPGIRRYVVMVQREVADRLAAPPGGKTYGGLSVWVQLLAEVREVRPLSRAIFFPQPRVDSGLVTLERRASAGILAERPALVRRVIDAAFAQRRKTLLNSLTAELGLPKAAVAEVLGLAGLVEGVRAEQVDPPGFLRLSEKLLQLLA